MGPILVVTNRRDITADFIILELRQRNINFVRLNCEDLASGTLAIDILRKYAVFESEHTPSIDLFEVSAGYFRRPGRPILSNSIKRGDESYCMAEWLAVMKSIYNIVEGRWLNSPSAIDIAEDKILQLLTARQVGFRIPETVISNDFNTVQRFASTRQCVAKAFSEAVVGGTDNEAVIFTTRLDLRITTSQETIRFAPIIVQTEVQKKFDIRVTVVGSATFAAAISSQMSAETQVDWRRGSRPDLPHEAWQLPQEIATKCIDLTAKLGLSFSAIDLVLDADGTYWFLEANPNGQWAWIENRLGLPIAAAIVDRLLSIAGNG